MKFRRRGLVLGIQVMILVVIIGGWEIGSRVHFLDPFFFSPPSVFLSRAFYWLADPNTLLGGRSIYIHRIL